VSVKEKVPKTKIKNIPRKTALGKKLKMNFSWNFESGGRGKKLKYSGVYP